MGVLDKFLDVMKMSDDEEEYEEEFFDDEEVEKKPKKSLFGFRKDRDDEEDLANSDTGFKATRSFSKPTPNRAPRRSLSSMEVRVIRPTSSDESQEIAEALCSGSTVLLNLEGADLDISQRIIDFTSGALFAINGNLQKVGNYIFLLTPSGVDVSGDMSSVIGNELGMSSFNSNL